MALKSTHNYAVAIALHSQVVLDVPRSCLRLGNSSDSFFTDRWNPISHHAGSIHPASNPRAETSPFRASRMMAALTEGVRRRHFPTSSRSAMSSRYPSDRPTQHLSQVQSDKSVAE